MNDGKKLGRREAIVRLAVWTGTAAAMPSVLVACSGPSGPSCSDVSGLQPAEVQMRTQQAYVENSTQPGRSCSQCNFFQAAAADQCGTCQVIRGPINPGGYCNLWAQRAS